MYQLLPQKKKSFSIHFTFSVKFSAINLQQKEGSKGRIMIICCFFIFFSLIRLSIHLFKTVVQFGGNGKRGRVFRRKERERGREEARRHPKVTQFVYISRLVFNETHTHTHTHCLHSPIKFGRGLVAWMDGWMMNTATKYSMNE